MWKIIDEYDEMTPELFTRRADALHRWRELQNRTDLRVYIVEA